MASGRTGRRHGDPRAENIALCIGHGDHRPCDPRPYASDAVIDRARPAPKRMQSGFVDMGSLRVHHMHGGRGSAVVFVHGLGSSGYMEWRQNLEATAARHRVFAPDLPGYGRTDKPRVRYSIPYFARFIRRSIEDPGPRSVVLVGTSLGGRIALEVALEQPRLVRKLVLVNTLGLGRPQVRMSPMAYGLVTLPRVGEAMIRLTRDALGWAPVAVIRRVAGRYAGLSSDLKTTMDDIYLGDLREMDWSAGFQSADPSTVRSWIKPRPLVGGPPELTHEVKRPRDPSQPIQ